MTTEEDEDLQSAEMEDEEVKGRAEELSRLAPEMATTISRLYRHLLKTDLVDVVWDQPGGRELVEKMEAICTELDDIDRR